MSRTGTMVDALRNVSEFSRASRPEERTGTHRHNKSAHSTYDLEDVEEEDRKERKRKRERDEEVRKSHDHARRRRKRSKKSSRRSDEKSRKSRKEKEEASGESSDEESSEDDPRERHSSRKHRKEERKDRRRKKKRESESKHRAAASMEDSTEASSERLSSDDAASSEEEEDDDDDRRERRSSRKHHRKQERKEKRGKKSRKGRRRSESKQTAAAAAASTTDSEESSETISNPDAIASEIAERFPEDGKDLKLLLEMLDSGQAVDISGLPNKSLVSLLRNLFSCLHLVSTQRDIFLLPEGAQPTVEIMSSFFEQNAGLFPTEEKIQLPPTVPDVVPGPSVKPAETNKKPRVMGPAMPSADMLAAAAKLTEAESLLREAEKELENDPLVGPPPPSVVAEAESANDAERFEEVTRMVARDVGNAYDVLGVKQDVNPTALKKRYWKLSLLVHPDKCSHPQAHEAFMALNQAFKDLQDPVKKAIIDRKVAEKQEKEEMEAEIRAQREAAQWRRVRGEALPGDDEILRGGPEEPSRDEWMTALPPERQAGGPVSQQNTFFSKAEKSGRGDTSIWTDTPADRAQKAKMQYLEAYKQATLTNRSGDAGEEIERREKERAEKEAQLMDSYNSNRRLQSLVEKHKLERLEGSNKKKKQEQGVEKQAGKGANQAGVRKPEEGWAGNHPWKPWDREKDLTAGRQSVNLDPKKFTEGLASRFGATQDAPRKFL